MKKLDSFVTIKMENTMEKRLENKIQVMCNSLLITLNLFYKVLARIKFLFLTIDGVIESFELYIVHK